MVSDQYNKNWLKLRQRFNIYLKGISLAGGISGFILGCIDLIPEVSLSNPITAVIGLAIGSYDLMEQSHSFFIEVRESQIDPSEWSNYFTHKNFR